MKESTNKLILKGRVFNNKEKILENIQNQSTELLQTEDIFINQKEEIQKIKKKRIESKNLNQNKTKGINLKCVKIRREKKYSTINNSNLSETQKIERNHIKSNIKEYKNLAEKSKKINLRNNNYFQKFKLKFPTDNTKAINKNKNKDKTYKIISINNNVINPNNISNYEEENTIINDDNENIKHLENEIDFISLLNINHFEKCDCVLKEKNLKDYYFSNDYDLDEIPKINEEWKNLTVPKKTNINKKTKISIPNIIINNNFNFSKIALRTKDIIDYNSKGVKINLHLKLFDESKFWIFTRCYVGNYFDEIKKYNTISTSTRKMNIDIQKEENKNNKMFSKYSTVIKIIKNKNSNKAFISFGTFYKNKKSGNLHYKTFLQRQLVDYIHEDNDYYYLENDLCEFDIIIIDSGNEFLLTKISLNNNEKYNNIKCNFYLPINKKAKIMFCGEGNNIRVTELEIKSFIKCDEDRDRFAMILSDERKACDCCSIV